MSTETAKKVTKPKSDKPTYLVMVSNGIRTLNDRHGSSRYAILKYVINTYNLDPKIASVRVNAAIKSGMVKGDIKNGKSKFKTLLSSKSFN
jgi:hypothetical protein